MTNHEYQPGVFWRLDAPTIKLLLVNEGWSPVLVDDEPGHVYPIHAHPETKLIAILHGGMEVKVEDETYRCFSGDKVVIAAGKTHAAVVGPEGCSYYWSEQIRT